MLQNSCWQPCFHLFLQFTRVYFTVNQMAITIVLGDYLPLKIQAVYKQLERLENSIECHTPDSTYCHYRPQQDHRILYFPPPVEHLLHGNLKRCTYINVIGTGVARA